MPVDWFSDCCTDPAENIPAAMAGLPQPHREMIWQQMRLMSSCPFLSQEKGSFRPTETTVSAVCMTEIMAALAQYWSLVCLHGDCFMSGWNRACGDRKAALPSKTIVFFYSRTLGCFLLALEGERFMLRKAHLEEGLSLKLYLKRGHILRCGLEHEAS